MKVRDFASTDPMLLVNAAHDVIVTAYAVVHTMDAMLWKQITKNNAWSDENGKRASVILEERENDILNMYYARFPERCYVMEFSGELTGQVQSHFPMQYNDVCHYDIDEALKETFGDNVRADSELGMFFVRVKKDWSLRVKHWLVARYPKLDFTVTDGSKDVFNLRPDMVSNWLSSERWLQEREIEIEYRFPVMDKQTAIKSVSCS
jgi:hypothetical protein